MSGSPSRVGRPPRVFFSVGEPSGDLHGSNLIHALRQLRPDVVCEGFGGERMEAAGCQLLYPLSRLCVVGISQVLAHIGQFVRLINQATEHLRTHRPDAVILVDYPGFNWWMARRARALGIPVIYFVPPQIWAWASWRVRKMRRNVDHVLSCLPFEHDWYTARGVNSQFIGHPYFDALAGQRLDPDFLAHQHARGETIIGILPGSRRQEVENNFASQVRAALLIHRRRPDCRFLVAAFKQEQAQRMQRILQEEGAAGLPLEIHVGRTPEIIHLAHSCLTVSGSVSLELLHACKPSVIVYRGPAPMVLAYRLVRNVKHISLVNLLAGRTIYPEHVTSRCPAPEMAEQILNWLGNESEYHQTWRQLAKLKESLACPGACARAAEFILSKAGRALAA